MEARLLYSPGKICCVLSELRLSREPGAFAAQFFALVPSAKEREIEDLRKAAPLIEYRGQIYNVEIRTTTFAAADSGSDSGSIGGMILPAKKV